MFKRCEFHLNSGNLCDNIVASSSKYCIVHECLRHSTNGKCKNPSANGSRFCEEHKKEGHKIYPRLEGSDGYTVLKPSLSDGYTVSNAISGGYTVLRPLPPAGPVSEEFINALINSGASDSFVKQVRNINKTRIKLDPPDLQKELNNAKFNSKLEKQIVYPVCVILSAFITLPVSFVVFSTTVYSIMFFTIVSVVLAYILYLLISLSSNKRVRIAELKYNESMESEWDRIIEEHDKENTSNIQRY